MATKRAQLASPSPAVQTANYNRPIGYLRAFIVALVVAHHAALAYYPTPLLPPHSLARQPRWWQAFPVVDAHKWSGFSRFVGFNDVFFMSLMFFLSGLFVCHGLAKKGTASFLRDRLLRLGLPFVVAAAILAPLAYYPTYLQIAGHSGLAGFWRQWLAIGQWPAGPAWFIWVLLTFDCLAAVVWIRARRAVEAFAETASRVGRKPGAFFAALVFISALAYIPMALHFTSLAWTAFGPFSFQTSRILHYFCYFLIGAGVGLGGVDNGLLALDGKLARRWLLWVAAAVAGFIAATAITLFALISGSQALGLQIAMHAGFVLSCAASCLAFLALFLRFAGARSPLKDSLAANSYGIYLLHYPFVSWLQYALLAASLPAVVKAAIVLAGALALSWASAAAMRTIPAVKRVV
jgi:peptidoglycan/LPS O-acetylase OafA/YrhL